MQGIIASTSCQHLSQMARTLCFYSSWLQRWGSWQKCSHYKREVLQTGQGSIKEDTLSIFYWEEI